MSASLAAIGDNFHLACMCFLNLVCLTTICLLPACTFASFCRSGLLLDKLVGVYKLCCQFPFRGRLLALHLLLAVTERDCICQDICLCYADAPVRCLVVQNNLRSAWLTHLVRGDHAKNSRGTASYHALTCVQMLRHQTDPGLSCIIN